MGGVERWEHENDSIDVPGNPATGGNAILACTERAGIRCAPVQSPEVYPGWRAQIDEIDPATIVVPYHIGKLIEDNKKVLLQNLGLVSLYSKNIPSKRSLSAEIDILGLLKEVHSNMDALSDTLVGMVASDQKKAQTWGAAGTITSGPLNAEEVLQIKAGGLTLPTRSSVAVGARAIDRPIDSPA